MKTVLSMINHTHNNSYRTTVHESVYSTSFCLKKLATRGITLLLGCAFFLPAKSQLDKRLALADQYFAAGSYYTAANLYDQFLHPSVKMKPQSDFPLTVKRSTAGRMGSYTSKTDILFRQAESYRLSNYWNQALALYQECVATDSVKYATALYWEAVCQRSMGNYDKAEEAINRYLSSANNNAGQQAAAVQEKQILQFIRAQKQRPDTIMYHIAKVQTTFEDRGVFAPTALDGAQYIFTSTQKDSVKGDVNPYHNRLFSTALVNGSYTAKDPVYIDGLDSLQNQGAASVSSDGAHLYFTQWKTEGGKTISAIYKSDKTATGWSKPQFLSVNKETASNKQPVCSGDGKYLYFASDREGGKGGWDIWYAPILADGTTGEAINAATINTEFNEQAPFYHIGSNSIVFASDRIPGMGGFDLYSAKGALSEWNSISNMGYPVNSSRDDIYFSASPKGALLDKAMISSDRDAECCLATYTIVKQPKQRMLTGMVVDCNTNEPIDSAIVMLKDATGNTVQTITASGGYYSFSLPVNSTQHSLVVSRDLYKEKDSQLAIESINDSNWQTDTLHSTVFCLEKKFVLKVENVVTVYFDFDKSDLNEHERAQLDSIYTIMTENPTYTLQISGYTDGKGSVAYNKKLSDKRAKSCADYLTGKGLDPARISFESFGSCCPVEMELINGRDNTEGRSKNRRALININKG